MADRRPRQKRIGSAATALAVIAPFAVTLILGTLWYQSIPALRRTEDRRFNPADGGGIAPATSSGIRFTDVATQSGVIYRRDDADLMRMENCGDACMAKMMSGGGAAGDYDGDGRVDLILTRMHAPVILYRNAGDGTFEDRTANAGLGEATDANGAGWADIDNDGDRDLYLTFVDQLRFRLYVNDGTGVFSEEGRRRGADVGGPERHQGFGVAFGDYDRDGWVDILTTQWGFDLPTSRMRLLRNRGAASPGYFEDATARAGFGTKNEYQWETLPPLEEALSSSTLVRLATAGNISWDDVAEHATGNLWAPTPSQQRPYSGQFSFAPAFADFDGDGWQDIAIAADFGTTRLFWNRRDGTFDAGAETPGIGTDEHGMGSAIGDIDGDGDLDWFVTSIGMPDGLCEKDPDDFDCRLYTGNRLYRNDGNRSFSDATDAAGVRNGWWGWGTVMFDYDNDGDLDLAMTNGMNAKMRYRRDPARFWENVGRGMPMTERAGDVGMHDEAAGKGMLTFDYDDDGDLDVLIVNEDAPPRLLRNDGGNDRGWIRVKVRGKRSNADGIGAKVTLVAADGAAPQVREIGVGSHFLGQNELVAHFGVGTLPTVREINVTWPASGKENVFRDVLANTELEAIEPE